MHTVRYTISSHNAIVFVLQTDAGHAFRPICERGVVTTTTTTTTTTTKPDRRQPRIDDAEQNSQNVIDEPCFTNKYG